MRPAPATCRDQRAIRVAGAASYCPAVMRSTSRAVAAAPQNRAETRHRGREIVAFAGVVLLLVVGAIAALTLEVTQTGRGVTSLLVAASVAGVIGILAWSGAGSRRGLAQDLEAAEARYRSMVEELPAVLYVADFGADAIWQYVSPRTRSCSASAPMSGWRTTACGWPTSTRTTRSGSSRRRTSAGGARSAPGASASTACGPATVARSGFATRAW
jgi:hypothetical protein